MQSVKGFIDTHVAKLPDLKLPEIKMPTKLKEVFDTYAAKLPEMPQRLKRYQPLFKPAAIVLIALAIFYGCCKTVQKYRAKQKSLPPPPASTPSDKEMNRAVDEYITLTNLTKKLDKKLPSNGQKVQLERSKAHVDSFLVKFPQSAGELQKLAKATGRLNKSL